MVPYLSDRAAKWDKEEERNHKKRSLYFSSISPTRHLWEHNESRLEVSPKLLLLIFVNKIIKCPYTIQNITKIGGLRNHTCVFGRETDI